jgi:hypothetical protein
MAESNKPEATGQAGELTQETVVRDLEKELDRLDGFIAETLVSPSDTAEDVIGKVREAAVADPEKSRELQNEIERIELDTPEDIFFPRLYTLDVTAETLQTLLVRHGERMSVLSDEGGIFLIMSGLYNGGAASLDVFLQAHAGAAVRVDRAEREAYLSAPTLSFGLALQPGILADVASNKRFSDSGLLARFLFAMPESTVGKRDVRKRLAMPAEVLNEYAIGINAMLDGRMLIPDKPKVLALGADALDCWVEFLEEIERQLGDSNAPEALVQWKSKLPGAVARIAGLIELASGMGMANTIGADAMTRAISLGHLLIPHAEAAFGLLGADQIETDAKAMLKWAQDYGAASFTRRDCQKAMEGRFRTVDTRQVLGLDYSVQPGPHWTYEGKSIRDLYEETYGDTE